jgi:predicted DNA-binding transcriptional regulator AlpA
VYHVTVSHTKTLTKQEVIELLGKSRRTIDTYMADGRLPYHYVQGPNGKQASYDAADVERLKRDLEAPIEPPRRIERIAHAVVERTPYALAPVAADIAASPVAASPSTRVKPWLTLEEAEVFSGLTKRWLLMQAEAGATVITVRDMGKNARGGRWRFSRASLDC